MGGRFFDLLAGTLTLATVTVLVTKPQTAGVIDSLGKAWAGVVRTAMGN